MNKFGELAENPECITKRKKDDGERKLSRKRTATVQGDEGTALKQKRAKLRGKISQNGENKKNEAADRLETSCHKLNLGLAGSKNNNSNSDIVTKNNNTAGHNLSKNGKNFADQPTTESDQITSIERKRPKLMPPSTIPRNGENSKRYPKRAKNSEDSQHNNNIYNGDNNNNIFNNCNFLKRAPEVNGNSKVQLERKEVAALTANTNNKFKANESNNNNSNNNNYILNSSNVANRVHKKSVNCKVHLKRCNFLINNIGNSKNADADHEIRKSRTSTNPANKTAAASKPAAATKLAPVLKFREIKKNVYQQSLKLKFDKDDVCECRPEFACDERCLNRSTFTECHPTTCPVRDSCTNQRLRRKDIAPGLEKFKTKSKGYGLRSQYPIKQETFVIEMLGEVITKAAYQERKETLYKDEIHDFAMALDKNLVIDCHQKGNKARYINHSCKPNCDVQKWTVDGRWCMAVFTTQDIKAGEELTIDYKFQLFNRASGQRCFCGSKSCRGIIGN